MRTIRERFYSKLCYFYFAINMVFANFEKAFFEKSHTKKDQIDGFKQTMRKFQK